MARKCKQGDMALVILGPSTGRVVTCVRELQEVTIKEGYRLTDSDLWEVDVVLDHILYPAVFRFSAPYASDSTLLPLGPPVQAKQKEKAEHV